MNATRNRHWPAVLALMGVLLLGAGPPEVIRLRVPSAQVSTWFPPGTELRGMPVDELDALIEAARAGAARARPPSPPRILQARHTARWEPDLLTGRSEFVIEPTGGGPAEVPLEPWTPAIEPAEGDAARLRVSDSGRTALRVQSVAPTTVILHWHSRARPNSGGRGFTLGMPALESTSVTLDLPARWISEGPPGLREGPLPGPAPDRVLWRYTGRGGLIDLRVHDPDERDSAHPGASVWVSGPTRIDLLAPASKPNWQAEWTVDASPHGPRVFAVDLDPGLELVDVSGLAVESFRTETRGLKTRLHVRLTAEAVGPVPVKITASAQVPAEGSWIVPAGTPVDALWTGGTTTVRLDPTRVLKEYRERAGRRVPPRLGEAADPNLLVFEARAPEAVAELVFRTLWIDVSAEVRGQLLLGNSAPRLRSRVTCKIHRGRLLNLNVDLPPAWVPDQVEIDGMTEALEWHPETRADGGVRVHVVLPALDPSKKTLALSLAATATVPGGRGPLALPRVRPVGIRVADELWVAWTDAAVTLQPTVARGLAWIDPKILAGAPLPSPMVPGGLHEDLAWRWLTDDAEAWVDRERTEAGPSGSIALRAIVDPARLRLDGRIQVDAGEEMLRALPLAASDPSEGAAAWRFEDEATGMDVVARPLADQRRAELGLPTTGTAWELILPQARPGKIALRARLDTVWNGRGRIPLLTLPERYQAPGIVSVFVARGLRATVQASGLKTLAPTVTARFLATDDERDSAPATTYRRASALGYSSPDDRLTVQTVALESLPLPGVIRDAVLTTYWSGQGANRQHLVMRVAADEARAFEFFLPAGSTLVLARRDGQEIVPTRTEAGLSIALPTNKTLRTNCTITLEYESSAPPAGQKARLRPELPTTALSCLGFTWQVVVPGPWEARAEGTWLRSTDPPGSPSAARRDLGSWRELTDGYRAFRSLSRDNAMLYDLDQRAAAIPPVEMSLGDWLTRWDSGPWPLVIDRLTLVTAGWGPRSRIVPPRFDSQGRDVFLAAVRGLGFAAVPVGGSLLITTPDSAPDRPGGPLDHAEGRAAWESALRQASAWGSDASDRFVSVARWRGEPTPKAPIGVGPSSDDLTGAGRRVWRFTSPGWPSPDASVRLMEQRSRLAWTWAVGCAVFALGIAGRGAPARLRAISLAFALAVGCGLSGFAPERIALPASGGVLGALAVLGFRLGQSFPSRVRERNRARRSPSTTLRTARGAGTTFAVLLGLSIAARGAWLAAEAPGTEERIVALLPYDGAPDLTRKPDRALLRLQDFDRLKALADTPGQPPDRLEVSATAAVHAVSWEHDGSAVVVSEFTLIGPSVGSALWKMPLENARDLSATLDGAAVPVFVPPGGKTAEVAVAGTGPHRLRFRRGASFRPGDGGDVLSLALNPVASARVTVEADRERRPIAVRTARGRVEPDGSGIAGWLGPADLLEVFRSALGPVPPLPPPGSIEGVLLWDAQPAGDHVRARLTCRNPSGTETLRLRLERGLFVRVNAIPGRVDESWQGTADRPEWVAHIDPPLPDGATIGLEFWRATPATSGNRSFPLIEPLGVRRFTGALAFRRPSDWSGRLTAISGPEVISEEAFVKLWGLLPDDPLTLSGVTRFASAPTVALTTGPVLGQPSVQPEVQLRIGPGRVETEVKAVLADPSGTTDQIECVLPEGFRLLAIDADGLTDWSRIGQDRVRLRFDGPPARQRTIRLQGWLLVPTDPLSTATASHEVAVPWVRWVGIDTRPAILTIASPTPCRLDSASGVTLISSEQAGVLSAPGAQYRMTYRVESPEMLGKLRWPVEPPAVGVRVESQLTFLPQSIEWTALLRYDISGGALDAVHLKLPTAWATHARVHMIGTDHQLTSETRDDSTFWTIRPEHPAWGSLRLVVRAALPVATRDVIRFPDLVPLGRGAADTYLAIVNGTGRELITGGSAGLQPIDYAVRFREAIFHGLPGTPTGAFRVRKEGWTLNVQVPGVPAPDSSGERPPGISLADIHCTIASDGSMLGMAQYEVMPRPGPFLNINAPPGSRPLWVAVNHEPVRPLRSETGQWLIPLDEDAENRVLLVWQAVADAQHRIVIPDLGLAHVPILLTVRAPEQTRITLAGGALEAVGLDRLEFDRVEWLGHRLAETLGQFDRSALREREALVSALVTFGLLSRGAERAVLWNVSGPATAVREERIRQVGERAKALHSSLEEALRAKGLDEFLDTAQVHLGLSPETVGKSALELPEPSSPIQTRQIGRAQTYQGESSGTERPITLTLSPAPTALSLTHATDWLMVVAAIVLPCVVLTFSSREPMPRRRVTRALLWTLGGLAAVGPWAVATGMGMALLGWSARRS